MAMKYSCDITAFFDLLLSISMKSLIEPSLDAFECGDHLDQQHEIAHVYGCCGDPHE
jgi:hypothetical protein